MLLRHKQLTGVDHSSRKQHQSKKLFHKWLIVDVWQQWTEPSVHSCCRWYFDIIKAGTWRVLLRPSSVLRLWLPWWVQRPPPRLEGLHRRWLPDRDELGLTSQTDLFYWEGSFKRLLLLPGRILPFPLQKRVQPLFFFLLLMTCLPWKYSWTCWLNVLLIL